ncbi:MAG TPA: hypothetical protein VN739_10145 [Nitrososphaerales archaeon]|nr:hypothetical protein [Nitrososphaerales archaeon]
MQNKLGALNRRTGGMVGHWRIVAFKAMIRLDDVRTKTKYVVIGRKKYNAFVFPVEFEKNLMIAVTFEASADPREIFAELMEMFEHTADPIGV